MIVCTAFVEKLARVPMIDLWHTTKFGSLATSATLGTHYENDLHSFYSCHVRAGIRNAERSMSSGGD